MGKKGDYNGGSTIVRPGTSWFGSDDEKDLDSVESQNVRFEAYMRAVRDGREIPQTLHQEFGGQEVDSDPSNEKRYFRASRLSPEQEASAKARRKAEKVRSLELRNNAQSEWVATFKVERRKKRKIEHKNAKIK